MGKYVIVCTIGKYDLEKVSIVWSMACNAAAFDHETLVFLQGQAGSLVRKGYVDDLRFPPFPPLKELIDNFLELNGKIIVCTPCLSSHHFEKEELIDGVVTAGGATLIEEMQDAVVLSY